MKKMNGVTFILNELNNGPVKTKDIAKELNCSVRSIQRYIHEISMNFPIVYDSKNSTYFFQSGYSLEKMKLTSKEAGLLILTNKFVKSLKNKSITDTFKNLKTRIFEKKAEDVFYIKFTDNQEYKQNEITSKLERFIINNESIQMRYEGNPKLLWNLKPVKIAYFDGFWYLLCIGLNDKIIKFSINKILFVDTINEHFKPIKNLNKLLDDSLNVWFEPKRNLAVKLKISKNVASYFKQKKFFPEQQIEKENKDGSLIVNCKAVKEQEIFPIIFQWIPHITILEPSSLGKEYKKIITKYLKNL
jgi:predicted DNA-binding transcriptional regulator YafY